MNMRHEKLFPCVGFKKAGDHAKVNFGQTQFVFDIDSLVEVSCPKSLHVLKG